MLILIVIISLLVQIRANEVPNTVTFNDQGEPCCTNECPTGQTPMAPTCSADGSGVQYLFGTDGGKCLTNTHPVSSDCHYDDENSIYERQYCSDGVAYNGQYTDSSCATATETHSHPNLCHCAPTADIHVPNSITVDDQGQKCCNDACPTGQIPMTVSCTSDGMGIEFLIGTEGDKCFSGTTSPLTSSCHYDSEDSKYSMLYCSGGTAYNGQYTDSACNTATHTHAYTSCYCMSADDAPGTPNAVITNDEGEQCCTDGACSSGKRPVTVECAPDGTSVQYKFGGEGGACFDNNDIHVVTSSCNYNTDDSRYELLYCQDGKAYNAHYGTDETCTTATAVNEYSATCHCTDDVVSGYTSFTEHSKNSFKNEGRCGYPKHPDKENKNSDKSILLWAAGNDQRSILFAGPDDCSTVTIRTKIIKSTWKDNKNQLSTLNTKAERKSLRGDHINLHKEEIAMGEGLTKLDESTAFEKYKLYTNNPNLSSDEFNTIYNSIGDNKWYDVTINFHDGNFKDIVRVRTEIITKTSEGKWISDSCWKLYAPEEENDDNNGNNQQ